MSNQKKRFTPEEKYSYHHSRSVAPKPNGLKPGGAKHIYSLGFTDGYNGSFGKNRIRNDFGKRAVGVYTLGHRRGRLAYRKKF